MLRITRDKAELGDAPFVTFKVYCSPKDNMTIYGHHQFAHQGAENKVKFYYSPFGIPVAHAFGETRRFAESKGISTIWIDDPNQLFELEQAVPRAHGRAPS
jgi:hypothetical protein